MIAVVTVLLALPLGLLCRQRLVANTAYAVAYLWAFTYQSVYLLVDSPARSDAGEPFPAGVFPLSYGVMTLLVLVVGFGLVEAGHRLGERRRGPSRVTAPA